MVRRKRKKRRKGQKLKINILPVSNHYFPSHESLIFFQKSRPANLFIYIFIFLKLYSLIYFFQYLITTDTRMNYIFDDNIDETYLPTESGD